MATLSSSNVINVQNLNVTFNNVQFGLQALRDISFKIKEGQFVSIIGPSGCGKSTLFEVVGDIMNNEEADISGRVNILGTIPKLARQKRKIGIVFQKPTLLEWRTIKDNIALPLEIMGFDKSLREKKIKILLKLVGLDDYSNFRPTQLSGGMQQRASIARALAYDPEILLMDEPFGALDEISRKKLNDELIKVWQKTKKTILFITHSIEEAVYLSESIIILSERPGSIKKIVEIKLPYPRKKYEGDVKIFKYINKVRKKLEE